MANLEQDTVAIMIMNDAYDADMEAFKSHLEATIKPELELRLHPPLDRLREIAKEWIILPSWTAEECAVLLMGADPEIYEFPLDLVPKADRKQFSRVLKLIERRFGNSVCPAEACKWAASMGMKQEHLEQALASVDAAVESDCIKDGKKRAGKPLSQKPKRPEDLSKLDMTRSRIIAATAKKRKYDEAKHNSAVGQFESELLDLGLEVNDETIRRAIRTAIIHISEHKSFEEAVVKEEAQRPKRETN